MIFDYQEFAKLVENFAEEIPELFRSHHRTAEYSGRVERLLQIAETRFTLAVVGQMRAGKSSLINALVGADLARVGVNETTATINYFKYGAGESPDQFRVVWKDQAAQTFPVAEIDRWIGQSADAERTRFLEFFAEAEFLKRVDVVDTPGTRSVIADHTETINEFLAGRKDSDTRRLGGEAHAILYVLFSGQRESDREQLSEFESSTRLPGSSPYNSLAVLHKWETLAVDDPHGEAQRKCAQLEASMRELVSGVLPVSAPLGKAAAFSSGFWTTILNLGLNASEAALDELLYDEEAFREDEIKGCPLSPGERARLRLEHPLPWPSLKLILRTARKRGASDAESLRRQIAEMSGLEQLRSQLDRRFFARSQMIKIFDVLAKAWEPCRQAEIRLRNHKNELSRSLDRAKTAKTVLTGRIAQGDDELKSALHYLESTRLGVDADFHATSRLLREVGEQFTRLDEIRADMDADLEMLDQLESVGTDGPASDVEELQMLFGKHGPEIKTRLRSLAEAGVVTAEAIDQRLEAYRKAEVSGNGTLTNVYAHAVTRIGQILDWMDEQGLESITLN